MCRTVATNHNLPHFFCWSLMLPQNEIFQKLNQKCRNAPYSTPDFIEWFIVKDLDIRNVKYCGSHLKFCCFINTKKIIFLKVEMTIIGENISTNCLQCIKYDNSSRKSLMWKKCSFILTFSKNRSYCLRLRFALNVLHIIITPSFCDIFWLNQILFFLSKLHRQKHLIIWGTGKMLRNNQCTSKYRYW